MTDSRPGRLEQRFVHGLPGPYPCWLGDRRPTTAPYGFDGTGNEDEDNDDLESNV